jgi:hypothetical protein
MLLQKIQTSICKILGTMFYLYDILCQDSFAKVFVILPIFRISTATFEALMYFKIVLYCTIILGVNIQSVPIVALFR